MQTFVGPGALRNRALHFTLTTGGELPVGVHAQYGRALNFVLWFLNSEFREGTSGNIRDLVEEVIENLTTEVGEIDDLVTARMETIAAELDGADVCVECPHCRQPALMLSAGASARCAFCLWTPTDGRAAAEEYFDVVQGISRYETVTHGGTWPIDDCVWCNEAALVADIDQLRVPTSATDALHCDGPARAYWGCFNCGETAGRTAIDRCARCDAVTEMGSDTGTPICANCFAEILRSD